jgi:hypothetical protein
MHHDDAMKLAVKLACSYLSASHSGSTDAEELILSYYRQIRNVEARLSDEFAASEAEAKKNQAARAAA